MRRAEEAHRKLRANAFLVGISMQDVEKDHIYFEIRFDLKLVQETV
jgi:hypothetical protein